MDTRGRGRPPLNESGTAKFLTIRASEAERESYREAAERAGKSLSDWIRERLNSAAKRQSKRD
jgi:predicted HicB family RNase H-like nuclease